MEPSLQAPGARTFEAQLKDGSWLHISERRTKDGGYVSVGTDITQIKLHEQKLIENDLRLTANVIDLQRSQTELERQAQLLAEAAGTPKLIPHAAATYTRQQTAYPAAGWFSFQPRFWIG